LRQAPTLFSNYSAILLIIAEMEKGKMDFRLFISNYWEKK